MSTTPFPGLALCVIIAIVVSHGSFLTQHKAVAAAPIAHPAKKIPPVPARSKDWFEDVTAKSGINFVHQFCHKKIANILLSNGAGAVVLDYDNDGFMDVYFLNWGPLESVTDPSFNKTREPNRLYRNRGNGTFEDVTRRAGVEGGGFASAAAAGDFDNDGWLDLYVGNYLSYIPDRTSEQNPGAYPGPLAYKGEANILYRNRGNGTFQDVTSEAGLYAPGHRAMSVAAFDCDRDGDADLYVCNDDTPNMLWLNDGRGHFREVAMETGVAFNSIGEAPGSMNAAMGDMDGDGLPDLFVTRLGYGSLYLRTKNGLYCDRMWASGLGTLTQKYVGWGGVCLDFDNDGDLDLFMANGDAFNLEGTVSLLLENDGNAKFTDTSDKDGAFFQQRINGRGSAVLDYDNDGRLDLLVTTLADRPFLLRNRSPLGNHWLKLQLEGTRSNRSGYGALITLTAGDLTLRAEALCPTGFLSQGVMGAIVVRVPLEF